MIAVPRSDFASMSRAEASRSRSDFSPHPAAPKTRAAPRTPAQTALVRMCERLGPAFVVATDPDSLLRQDSHVPAWSDRDQDEPREDPGVREVIRGRGAPKKEEGSPREPSCRETVCVRPAWRPGDAWRNRRRRARG